MFLANISHINKIVSKAIIKKNNYYLLQLRDNKQDIPYPNTWGFFGGECENGETPEKCLIRELYEEIEFIVNELRFSHFTIDERYYCKVNYFLIDWHLSFENIVLHEGQYHSWFREDQIKYLNAPFVSVAIETSIKKLKNNSYE